MTVEDDASDLPSGSAWSTSWVRGTASEHQISGRPRQGATFCKCEINLAFRGRFGLKADVWRRGVRRRRSAISRGFISGPRNAGVSKEDWGLAMCISDRHLHPELMRTDAAEVGTAKKRRGTSPKR